MCVALGASYLLGYTPLLIMAVYFFCSVMAYIFYAKDKSAARSKKWRVPENTLHAISLCGGWLGAVYAQERLRHKTQKSSFLLMFWLTVVLNVAAFCCLHIDSVGQPLRNSMSQVDQYIASSTRPSSWGSTARTLFQYR